MLHMDVQVGDILGLMTLGILVESPPEQRAPQFAMAAERGQVHGAEMARENLDASPGPHRSLTCQSGGRLQVQWSKLNGLMPWKS